VGVRLLVCVLAVGLGAAPSGWAQVTDYAHAPRNFIYFGLERYRVSDARFLANPSIAGAQLKYTWRELEPERDRYELSAIRLDLARLEQHGKQLFIQLQDVSFDEGTVNVPDYLREDPAFGGGVAMKYEFEDDDESRPIIDGWVARRWDPAVRERFAKLLGVLAEEFDGRIAGLNLAETSIGFGGSGDFHPTGFSYDTYFEGIKDLMSSARCAFRESDVIIYANFMPGEELPSDDRGYLRGVYAHADRIGVGVGGPDLLPHRWFQRQNSLALIAQRAPGTVAGMAVQDGNLEDTNRQTGQRVTVGELYAVARDELHLDYIFWGTQEPFFSHEIVPFLERLANRSPSSGLEGEAREIFSNENRLVTEGRVFAVATDDVNRDGRPDIVVSDYLNPARILYNDSALTFAEIVPLTATEETATTGHGVALGDFNGDGHLDLFLVYNEFPSRILFADGAGRFTDSGRAIGMLGLSGTSVDVADVDQDGDLDAFVTYYRDRARLYLNDGTGVLSESDQKFFAGVAVGDIDGDGDVDVLSLREEGPAAIWSNEQGRFTLQDRTVGDPEGTARFALVDTDGDGDLDVIAVGRTIESSLWENDGRGTFQRTEQTFNPGPRIAVGDLDRDGDTDLVIGPSVWVNGGGGRFDNVQTIVLATTTTLHLVDIDGDGDLDLLGAGLDRDTGKSDLRLFLNALAGRR